MIFSPRHLKSHVDLGRNIFVGVLFRYYKFSPVSLTYLIDTISITISIIYIYIYNITRVLFYDEFPGQSICTIRIGSFQLSRTPLRMCTNVVFLETGLN